MKKCKCPICGRWMKFYMHREIPLICNFSEFWCNHCQIGVEVDEDTGEVSMCQGLSNDA